MKNLNRTNIILLISLVFLVAAGVLYFTIYFSFVSKMEEVNKLALKNRESKSSLDGLQRIENNLTSTLGTADNLRTLFIPEESIADFIQVIESLMKERSLVGSVDAVSVSESPELAKVGKQYLQMTLSASGGFNDVMKFEGLLEKLPYKVTIDSVTLNYVAKEKGEVSKGGPWRLVVMQKVVVIKTTGRASGESKPVTNTTDEEL